MKKILLAVLVAPILVNAQTTEPEQQYVRPKHEIVAAAGINFYPSPSFSDMHSADVNFTLGYMRNFSNFQLGVRLEGGSDFFFYNYLSPVFVINKTFNLKRSYLYAGSAIGYYHNRNYMGTNRFNRPNLPFRQNGYSFGLQGGGSLYLNDHLSLTTEVAVRSIQVWNKDTRYVEYIIPVSGTPGNRSDVTHTSFSVSFPVTIGIRYQF